MGRVGCVGCVGCVGGVVGSEVTEGDCVRGSLGWKLVGGFAGETLMKEGRRRRGKPLKMGI